MKKDDRIGLLSRLNSINLDDPKPVYLLAKEIGISSPSMYCFIKGTRETNLVTMAKIERYIIDRENHGK